MANLVFFVADGALHFWTGASLSLPALLVGCCAGTLYVQTFTAIDRELEPCKREIALSTASAGTPTGILLADLTGLVTRTRTRARARTRTLTLTLTVKPYLEPRW